MRSRRVLAGSGIEASWVFGKKVVMKTDAGVVLSQNSLVCLAKLQRRNISISVSGE